jgi:hypothetical protein
MALADVVDERQEPGKSPTSRSILPSFASIPESFAMSHRSWNILLPEIVERSMLTPIS